MPRGNWSKRLAPLALQAAVVTGGIGLFWWVFYSAGFSSGRHEERTNLERKHYATDAAKDIEKCPANPQAALRKCIYEIAEAEHEAKRNESDLAAQWQAADWVKWAAILGAAQLVVSGIGLWALLITIDQGRRALKAARKANEISHDSAKRELRAYMTFSEIVTHHVPDTNIWKMQLAWKNAGQTPARRVCTNADWAIFDANVPPDFPFAYDPAHDDGSLVEVGPGQPIYGLTPKDFPLATFPQIVAGKKCAIVWSSVDYTDVFGDEHRIEWSAFLVVNKNPDGTYGLIYRGFDRFCGSDELCMRKPYADNQETRYSR